MENKHMETETKKRVIYTIDSFADGISFGQQRFEAKEDVRDILGLALADKTEVRLNSRITVEPFLVPHRDEFSETVGYRIKTSSRSLVFIPDIDKWSKWQTPLAEVVRANDILLVDGTFYADGEIARPMSEVPHPFVTETMELLNILSKGDRAKVHFIHFNHSNPLVQRDRKKLAEVRSKGFRVATTGLKLDL